MGPLVPAKCTAVLQQNGPEGAHSGTGRVQAQDQHPPRPGITLALHLGDAMVLTGTPASAGGSSSAKGLDKPSRVGIVQLSSWRPWPHRVLSECHCHRSLVLKPFSPWTGGKLQLIATSNQPGLSGVGKIPTDSSGNIKNELNQVSSLFEEAIKIKGDHTSTMLSSFSNSIACQQLECILHRNVPFFSRSSLYKEPSVELPPRSVSPVLVHG